MSPVGNSKGIFITGTDTEVGKTTVCGLLGCYLKNRGYRAITQKWVQTGSKGFSGDIDLHLKLMGRKRKEINDYLPYVSAYSFAFPASPHLAAVLEKRVIDAEKIKQSFKFLSRRFEFIIVEGSGGVLVPFNRRNLLIDIARELNLPVLLVAANKLGAINHTLLTVEALRNRNMKIIGIIFNNLSKKVNKIILKDNIRIVRALSGETVLGTLLWVKDKNSLRKAFIPIGKRILINLKRHRTDGRLA
jgi:dethiobiotin synthetase